VNHNDLFELVLQGLAEVEDPATQPFALGGERRTLVEVWEILEVFPAFGDELSPEALVVAAAAALGGRAPEVAGLADHDRLGDLWKGSRGDFSVGAVLLAELPPVAFHA
jgi:hypothetical protein